MNDEKNTSKPHSKSFQIILVAIPSIIIVLGTAWQKGCFDSEKTSKATTQVDSSPISKQTGNHNINVQNAEGGVHIITVNQLIDVRGAADTLIENAPTEKTYTAQEFMDEISKKRKQRELKTTEQEAEKQADIFLATLTFQLAKEADRKKRYNSYLEVLPEACNIVFNEFILNYVDSYVSNLKNSELAKQYNLDQLTIEGVSDIKTFFAQNDGGYTIRIIRLPNLSYVKISFQTGAIIEKKS